MSDSSGALRTFRKRPVVIEACQWYRNGDHPEAEEERTL